MNALASALLNLYPVRVLPRCWVIAASAALTLSAVSTRAQAPRGSDALSPTAVAESLAVLRMLDSSVRANPDDAAAWHRLGMVAWALYERDRTKPPISGLDWTLLGRKADTSLRRASLADPGNAHYRMMAGRFLLTSGVSITRLASYGFFEAALEAARKGDDPSVLAETAVEAGRVHWRRYDALENRWIPVSGAGGCSTGFLGPTGLLGAGATGQSGWARIERTALAATAQELGSTEYSGEASYLRAEELFREAFEALPSYERAFRQMAMLLVARSRWSELQSVARRRVESAPWDAWAWMTLGLSLHRAEADARTVAAAFDSAFKLLPSEERRRLDQLERVLRPADTTRSRALDPATHAATERLYWLSADPLWSRQGNEPRIEFLARVAYSELRWTVEEMKVRGADTDRGDIHIRFGPPDLISALGPMASSAEVHTSWVYDIGMRFCFTGMPTFATARHTFDGRSEAEFMISEMPARWDNIGRVTVGRLPVQVARFRARADSVDVFVATLPPIDSILRSSDINTSVRSDYWLLAGGTVPVAHDSIQPVRTGVQTFTHRVPRGVYVFRAEASADGALLGAMANGAVAATRDTATGFDTRGFGMSDLLVATRAESRAGTARRWTDLALSAQVGPASAQQQLALVWENYGLSASGGNARYTITISLERERSTIGRIAARVVGSVGRTVGLDQTPDRLLMRFDREVPHAEAVLDNITLALGETPAGTYHLGVSVTDVATGRIASRAMLLIVRGR